jgi:PPOX class probable F420-dependent enzyme
MIDRSTPAGSKASAMLADAAVAWLTTVRSDGQPQASPVWFVVDDDDFLIYSMPTQRVRNIGTHPKVAVNLESNDGSDVVSVEGTARIVNGPSSLDHEAYMTKYRSMIERMGSTPEEFASAYSIPIRVTPTRWRVY